MIDTPDTANEAPCEPSICLPNAGSTVSAYPTGDLVPSLARPGRLPYLRDVSHAPTPTVDVVAIGNALVDVLSHETPEFVTAEGLTPGSMTLIDEDRAEQLYGAMGPAVEVSGGSAANTMVGIASFGGTGHFVGRVRDDQLGEVFAHDLRSVGIGFDLMPAIDGPATGRCLILVTPDGERTMNTYLGASTLLGGNAISPDTVTSGGIIYLEGYLFDRDEAKAAFRAAASIAHDAGRQVALSLSDSFCVDRHRDEFLDLVNGHVDILFANEDEITSLYQVDSFDEAVERVRGSVSIAALTRSADGSTVATTDGLIHVAAEPVAHVVDTTGAGDLYAAGFLFGLARDCDLASCARLGSIAAAEVISHVGARPVANLAELAAPVFD